MTDPSDREIRAHRSHKAPESVRNLLKKLGFKGPKDPLGDLPEDLPEDSIADSEDE